MRGTGPEGMACVINRPRTVFFVQICTFLKMKLLQVYGDLSSFSHINSLFEMFSLLLVVLNLPEEIPLIL